MPLLKFEIKRGLQGSPKIYVISSTTQEHFGSFFADREVDFAGWDKLSPQESVELKHYIDNVNAVKKHIGDKYLTQQATMRFRLPLDYIGAIEQISLLSQEAGTSCNVYEGMVVSSIQSLKIAIAHLPSPQKIIALNILDSLGLAEYKKIDYSTQIKAIFAEVSAIHNKSEHLKAAAARLFGKEKSYSPATLASWAAGERPPGKWVIACAIDVLLIEKAPTTLKILSMKDIAILWAKPLLHNNQKAYVYRRIKELDLTEVYSIIEDPKFPIDKSSLENESI